MNRVARLSLTAGAVALVCACSSDRVNQPISRPLASLSDGANEGNPDFFFLPPLVPNPSNHPDFEANAFNAAIRPTVEICELAPLEPPATIRECATTIKTFAMGDITLDAASQHYQVDWNTDESNLIVTNEYRIRVLLGAQLLGYADVDPVESGDELKNVDTGELIGLKDGSTLPIKFRIENAALCGGVGPCNSKTIDLQNGGTVVLEATGDRVDIPAQPSGPNSTLTTTVTLQLCDGIDIDLPVFGNCLRVTADPLLRDALQPRATVSMCSLQVDIPGLTHEQEHLVSLHRQDGNIITVLPHSTDFCNTTGRAADAAPQNLADAGWRLLRRGLSAMFGVRPLHAATAALNVGPAGDTEGFSDFQFALPAQMLPLPGTDAIFGLLGQAAAPVPGVLVQDGQTPPQPVSGAVVRFQITGGDGNFGGTLREVRVTTDAEGRASVPLWILGIGEAANVTTASGRGFAGPSDAGPFVPDIQLPFKCVAEQPCQTNIQLPTPTDARTVVFTATTLAPDLVVSPGVLTVTPASIEAGGTVTLSAWTNLNQGDGDATSGVNNGFYLSTDPVITASDVRLDGNSNTADVLTAGNGFAWGAPTLTIPAGTAPGTYYIGILVDETDALLERNEANNYVSTPLIVVAAPGLP